MAQGRLLAVYAVALRPEKARKSLAKWDWS